MAVDTRRVVGRRRLHFHSIEEVEADLDRLSNRPVRTLGNWSAGMILQHLAIAMNLSIDGAGFRPNWLSRTLGPFLKGRMLRKGFPAGFQFNEEMKKALMPGETSWEAGLTSIRKAITRQKTEANRAPNPFFGPLTRDEWDQFHCRHSELHLSYIVPN